MNTQLNILYEETQSDYTDNFSQLEHDYFQDVLTQQKIQQLFQACKQSDVVLIKKNFTTSC